MADEHRGLWMAQELRDPTIARAIWDEDLIHAHYLRLKRSSARSLAAMRMKKWRG